jgi:hypothetical protein
LLESRRVPASVVAHHDKQRLVIIRTGPFTANDLLESIVHIRDSGAWAYSALVDARKATTDLSPEDASGLIAAIQKLGDPGTRGPVAVVAGDDLTFGMVRVLSAYAEGIGMRVAVFRTMDAALAWLNV